MSSEYLKLFLQTEEDPSLIPDIGSEGYQFDPASSIPKEGFNFWLEDSRDIGSHVEITSEPIQIPAAVCDTLVNQPELLAIGDSSNLLSVKDETCSNASTCGSERSANQLNSYSSSETRSSNVDINQVMDENENFESVPTSLEARGLWGERSDEQRTEENRSSEDAEQYETDRLDHSYIRGNFSNDPDLMTWYCLGTC